MLLRMSDICNACSVNKSTKVKIVLICVPTQTYIFFWHDCTLSHLFDCWLFFVSNICRIKAFSTSWPSWRRMASLVVELLASAELTAEFTVEVQNWGLERNWRNACGSLRAGGHILTPPTFGPFVSYRFQVRVRLGLGLWIELYPRQFFTTQPCTRLKWTLWRDMTRRSARSQE